MDKTFNLYEKKREIHAQAKAIQEKAVAENREMTSEELASFEKAFTDMEAIDKQVEAEKKFASQNVDMSDPFLTEKGEVKERGDAEKDWNEAFSKYMRLGVKSLTPEQHSILALNENEYGFGVQFDPTGKVRNGIWKGHSAETRASNSVITNAPYMAPITLAEQFAMTQKAIGPWMEACTTLNTPTGETMYMPYYDDAGNDGTIEAEGTDAIASSVDLDSARQQLDSYWVSSTGVKVGISALRDTDYPLQDFVIEPLMKRLARILSGYGTTGTGSSQPQGLITPSGMISELVSASTTPDADDLNAGLKLCDYSYHTGDKSGFMFNSDTMFRIAATVKSSTYNTEPLWQPSFAQGIPSTLYGYPYWINNSLDKVGANKNIMLFGDFSYFILRYAGPLMITRLDERYAEAGQVGFLISQYFDSEWRLPVTGTYTPAIKFRNLGT